MSCPTSNTHSTTTMAPPSSSAPGSESDANDAEFEPTAEMMMDEFDDERTLDEAEAANDGEDQEEEISNLQKEQDMPLEELLALYTPQHTNGERAADEEEPMEYNEGDEEEEEEDEEVEEISASVSEGATSVTSTTLSPPAKAEAPPSRRQNKVREGRLDSCSRDVTVGTSVRGVERRGRRRESDLIQLYPELEQHNGDAAAGRALRSSGQQSEDDEDEEGGVDGEGVGGESGGEEPEQEDCRKTIMIGSAYQAQVPEGLQMYGATPPYENQDKLLWAPHLLNVPEVEKFLYSVHQPPLGTQGVGALPLGLHIRDDEQALHLLLQCGGNVEEARRRHNMNPTPLASTMTLWSEEECRNFENGLKNYGKDFHMIQQNKVRTRSVGELVQFYYLWKKTERHDMFAAKTRLEKKKFVVHPGTTDYMDRFLDEGEGLFAACLNNNNNGHIPPSSTVSSNIILTNIASPVNCATTVTCPNPSQSVTSNSSLPESSDSVTPSSKTVTTGICSPGGKRKLPQPEHREKIFASESAVSNRKLWKENQKPNAAVHALLYGVLPPGYKVQTTVKESSKATARDRADGTVLSRPPTVQEESKCSEQAKTRVSKPVGEDTESSLTTKQNKLCKLSTEQSLSNQPSCASRISPSHPSVPSSINSVSVTMISSKSLVTSSDVASPSLNTNSTSFNSQHKSKSVTPHRINKGPKIGGKAVTRIDLIAQTLSREKTMASNNASLVLSNVLPVTKISAASTVALRSPAPSSTVQSIGSSPSLLGVAVSAEKATL